MATEIDRVYIEGILWDYARKVITSATQIDKELLVAVPYEKIGLIHFERKLTSINYHYNFRNIEDYIQYEWKSSIDLGNLVNEVFALPETTIIKDYIQSTGIIF